MKVYVNLRESYGNPIKYTLGLLSRYTCESVTFVKNAEDADVEWNHLSDRSRPIALDFYEELSAPEGEIPFQNHFKDDCVIRNEAGRPDHLATIFYMVNCLQELNAPDECLDGFGRFKYASSYQFKFGNIAENVVGKLIDAELKDLGWKKTEGKTSILLSHDIDTMYGSLIQDGFWVLKKGRIDLLLKLLMNHFLKNPDWRNIDKILSIHSEFDVRSTFFWLVLRGKGEGGVRNSDYSVSKEKHLIAKVKEAGFSNGLHKAASGLSFAEELKLLPDRVVANRYHFLKFKVHDAWSDLAATHVKLDASLGFAEHYGFRNSFGDAFKPYDFETGKARDFVSVPLVFMDTTFKNYLKLPKENIADTVIAHLEKNSTDCLYSILWHNNFFSDHKFGGYLGEYKKVLSYIYDAKIEAKLPEQIINQFLS